MPNMLPKCGCGATAMFLIAKLWSLFRGQEISIRCSDYDQAVKWARIECKSYKVVDGFTVER